MSRHHTPHQTLLTTYQIITMVFFDKTWAFCMILFSNILILKLFNNLDIIDTIFVVYMIMILIGNVFLIIIFINASITIGIMYGRKFMMDEDKKKDDSEDEDDKLDINLNDVVNANEDEDEEDAYDGSSDED